MRIGINTRVLLKNRMEGVARYIHETVSRMALTHPEDQFYLFFDRSYDSEFKYADNVFPIVIGPQARHPVLWYIWFEWSLPNALKKYNIEVYLSPDTYLSLSSRVPCVLVTHDLAYLHYPEHLPKSVLWYYERYFPLFHEKANAIIAVSDYTKKDIVKSYNISEQKISVAYNAVSNHFKEVAEPFKEKIRTKYSEGRPYLIYVGSLHPRKNIVNLIRAFELFKQKDKQHYKLLLVGRKAWKHGSIDRTLENSPYRKDIVHLNDIQDELPFILGSAQALVYISLFEGFGIPLLEAMQCGIPVITSCISSMPEVAGDAALLVDPANIQQIAENMYAISTDKQLGENLMRKGYQRVSQFSWDESAQIIYDKLKEIAVNN